MPRIADATVGGRLATFSISAGRASAEEIAQQVDAIGVVQTRPFCTSVRSILFFFFKNQIEYKEADQKGNKLLPGGQVHLKLLISSVKVPPLRQGETGAHSLILTLGVLLVQHVLLQDDRQFIGCAGLAQCVAGYTQV